MAAAAKASALTFVGIAKETTPMTGVAPTFYLPLTKFDPADNQRWLDDLGWRGSMATEYGEVAGVLSSDIDLGGNVVADTIPWALASILGGVGTVGASAPFTHTISLLNSGDGQGPSYTLTDYYGRTDATPSRQYAGARFGELTLKADAEGIFTWEGKAAAIGSIPIAKPTAAWTAVTFEPAWEGTCTIGGSLQTILESFEITIARQQSVIFNIDGNAAPYQIHQGKLNVKGKLTTIMETDVEFARFEGASKALTSLVLDYTHGAAAALVEVKLQMTQVQYVAPTKFVRGKEYVQVEIEFVGIANATDVGASAGLSPILATVQNALPAATYV
jgi:hypothetical protein